MLSIQTCNLYSNSSFNVADVQMITSSAYIFITQASTANKLEISLINNKKKMGLEPTPVERHM